MREKKEKELNEWKNGKSIKMGIKLQKKKKKNQFRIKKKGRNWRKSKRIKED